MDTCAHTAVQTDAADIDGVVVVDPHNVQRRDLAVHQCADVHELALFMAELLHEVIARAAGEHGHGYVGQTHAGGSTFVDRTVAAAGIHTQVALVFGIVGNFLRTVPGAAGDVNFVLCFSALKGLLNEGGGKGGAVALTGCGVDDK